MKTTRLTPPWAGLVAGPCSWALNTISNYALLPWACTHRLALTLPLSALFAIVALSGAAVSFSSHRRLEACSFDAQRNGEPKLLLAAIGESLGLLFALVILMQGAASFVLDSCVR